MALICGGIIGIERGQKRQAAGFRTYILVCIGSMIAVMCGQYATDILGENADPTRMGAQVVSGIGFLGVGTIIITQSNRVKGLTTAAGLWANACIGIAIGMGFYEAAIFGTLTVVFAVVVLAKFDYFFYQHAPISEFYLEYENGHCVRELINVLKTNQMQIISIEMQKSKFGEKKYVGVLIVVKKASKKNSTSILEVVSSTGGLVYIEEII